MMQGRSVDFKYNDATIIWVYLKPMEKNVKSSTSEPSPDVLYLAEQVRELDRILIEERGIPGLTLMRRAALACVAELLAEWPEPRRIRVYCGSGNNAADGYIVAGILAEKGIATDVILVGDVAKLSADGRAALKFCKQSGAKILDSDQGCTTATVIVDALLGTGFKGGLRAAYKSTIDSINSSDIPVLAVDVPSGLDVDTGAVPEVAVIADLTVTFIAYKRGLFTGQGVDVTGKLKFAALGATPKPVPPGEQVRVLNLAKLLEDIPTRPKNAHKFQFGHVLIVGGDLGMGGAPLMSALAAMRLGAGLVSLATRPEHASILMAHQPELMIRGVSSPNELKPLLLQADIVVLGPGLGRDKWGQMLYSEVMATDLPLVVDADGLNLLASKPVKRGNWVLTPHPGEAARLLDIDSVGQDRFKAAKELQDQYGGVVVLKGAGSIVVANAEITLCPYGNPGMSTAGMGDVLCGAIGGLWAQLPDALQAVKLGVSLHSAAGDRCAARAGQRGILATDIIPVMRELLNGI
tara:strand:+ start:4991 stop:6556 length:1566 start_codon:yes stop_codon:yes gene_type:complete